MIGFIRLRHRSKKEGILMKARFKKIMYQCKNLLGLKRKPTKTNQNKLDELHALVKSSISDSLKLKLYEEFCSWPSIYYSKTTTLIKLLNPKLIVEVGVAYGYHARAMLETLENVEYIGIDPYLPNYDPNDPFTDNVAQLFNCKSVEGMDRLYETVNETLTEEFGSRFTLKRLKSVIASTEMSNSIDLVFIDGDHRYQAVYDDLRSWWPKIRPGGVLAGDDYEWPEVRSAVNSYFTQMGEKVLLLTDEDTNHHTYFVQKSDDKNS